jgi:hypothetical protein
MTVLDERDGEGRSREAAEPVALAARRRDLPARHRRIGLSVGLVAQEKAETAAGTCREREPPRRHEVGVVARELGHDGAGRLALQRFLHRPQRIAGTRHFQDDEAREGKPHHREPGPVKLARLGGGKVGTDPDRLSAPAESQHGERHGEPGRRAAVARCGGTDLMDRAAIETAVERPVERF